MKTLITFNLLKFTSIALILTIIFRYGLSTSLTNEMFLAVFICAAVYGILMFLSGSYFGKKEYYEDLPIYDIGFRFHLATYLVHNLISLFWFLLGFESSYENVSTIYITAIIWGVFLVIHLIYYISIRKSSIKNLDKNDIFE